MKKFYQAAAKYILGEKSEVNLRASRKEVTAIKEALVASKNLYETLNREDVTLDEVRESVSKKRAAAQKFKKATGKFWLL